jgi:dephospho-CoA kinase
VTSSGSHILRVGVTGGIGSGKSLVCSLFSHLNVPVLSADDIAKELMQSDKALRQALVVLLGAETFGSDGTLNRKHVAEKIFSSPGLQRKVNQLVHPRVEAEIQKRFGKLAQSGNKIAIVEAALIYEAGFDKQLDTVIVVDAPEEDRIRRVVERDRTTVEAVRKRIVAQAGPESKIRKADYVIKNSGSVIDLEQAVRFLFSILTTIAEEQ